MKQPRHVGDVVGTRRQPGNTHGLDLGQRRATHTQQVRRHAQLHHRPLAAGEEVTQTQRETRHLVDVVETSTSS